MSAALAGKFLTTSATWEVHGVLRAAAAADAVKSLQSCPHRCATP